MTNKRAVALIDLLGIKSLTLEKSTEELDALYRGFINLSDVQLTPLQFDTSNLVSLFRNHPIGQPLCQRHILSDSIVLVANTANIEDTLKVVVSAWRILQSCMAMKRPVRGSIVYDEIVSRPHENYLIGKALVKAHELESRQNWMGITANDTLVEELRKEQPTILNNLFHKYSVPMKTGPEEHWALNWRFNFVVEKGTRWLFEGNSCHDKVHNTLAFAKSVVDSGSIYATSPEIWPVELQCFFIGEQRPPFDHGDEM